ncbi:MAG TPA: YtxH domain-containing protein [Candidatus Eremiobacteraeota bacterium]|nr:MAG: YtxH-like protein [bacterium ADurb.Bin363]HPZ08890.1 YtxH domain-containing protein [Candidatus Eremiobacteraeota bacterium]
MEKGKGLDFFLGFLTGTLVGAAIAIILAPQSGEETREYLKDQAILIKDKASEVASDMRDKATEIAGEVKDKADKMRDKAVVIATEVKQSVMESRDKLKSAISSAKKDEKLVDETESETSEEDKKENGELKDLSNSADI